MAIVMLLTVATAGCGSSASLPVFNPFDTVDAGDCGSGCVDAGADRGQGGRDPGQGTDPGEHPTDSLDPDVAVAPVDPGADTVFQDPGTGDPGASDLGLACTSTPNCDLGQLCINSHCIPGCQSERDCPDGMRCDAADGPHGGCKECLVDEDCGGTAKCVNGACASICTSDADCLSNAALPRCSMAAGVCVGCLQDSDCPIGNVCESTQCVPGCRGDRDCAQPSRCDLAAGPHGACVECLGSGDCASPKTCKGDICVIDCTAIQCPVDRPLCLPESGDCVACVAKADCGTGKVCSNHQCAPGCGDDNDCTGGWHCLSGGNGSCVECLLDGQCGSGKTCRNNACTTANPSCHQDSDCKGGQYCHPVLKDCRTIPPNACAVNGDCGIFGIGGHCDPLTRTCIDPCTVGLCGVLGSTTTPVCVDGGCYQCGSNADCPGTQCSLFDRSCGACTGDNDCIGTLKRCDPVDGKCYGCLSDGQCGTGRRCEPVGRTCVECLSGADCKTGGKPVCGKDGTCIATCTDECTTKGDVFCVAGNPDAYVECGDWDNDPCLEIGSQYGPSGYACPPVQQCDVQPDGIHGQCTCHDECASGQAKCDSSGYLLTCDQNSNSGCWYWGTHSCASNQLCSAGKCVCNNACSPSYPNQCHGTYTLDTCYKDSSGCYYWYTTTCANGGQCYEPGYCY